MKKYQSRYSKENLKEIFGMSEPDELENDEDEATRHDMSNPKIKIIFQNMLRLARANGVTGIKANQLTDEILELFFLMIQGGFAQQKKSIFLKYINMMKQRMEL
jgi:hypothetical protein